MEKLETAWGRRYNNSEIDSLDEGRDHLDKIFQLRLSLPPKTSFPIHGSEKEPNELIKQFLKQYLKNELQSDLQDFIINGFPPNPRKIKRALSLAYFIGKNIKIIESDFLIGLFQGSFVGIFMLILIWSVTTLYFPDLAELVRKSPYLLVHLCVIVANTRNIGNLQLKVDKFDEYIKWYRDNAHESVQEQRFNDNQEFIRDDLTGYLFLPSVYDKIDTAALTFAKKHLVNNVSLDLLRN